MLISLVFTSSSFVSAQQGCAKNSIDVIFTPDSSRRMMVNDPQGLRRTSSHKFVDGIDNSYGQAGVVSRDDNIDFAQELTAYGLLKT